jgi:hypothetical protein
METCEETPVIAQPSPKRPVSPQPDCILSVGSQCLAAAISAEEERDDTSLHVFVQGSPSFWADDTGVLQTPDVEIAVRICTIHRIDCEEQDQGANVPVFSIGLEQLHQPAVKLRPQPAPAFEAPPSPPWYSFGSLTNLRLSLGGAIALGLVAAPVVIVAAVWKYRASSTDSGTPSTAVVSPAAVPSSAPIAPLSPTVTEKSGPAIEILRLPGVGPFLNPDVAKLLELTPTQMGVFSRLDKTTQEALKDLEKYWQNGGRLESARRRDVLMDAAREEALQVLTERQRQKWDSMAR